MEVIFKSRHIGGEIVKVYSLIENVPYGLDDQYEHGLSLYIETNNHKILFDTGQTGAFIENAKRLGVKLEEINLVVLSHGHYDHTGGLQAFLKVNSQAPIYLSTYAFGEHYNAMNKYIGMDLSIQISNRLIFVEDYLKIDDELELCSCNRNEKKYPIESAGLKEKKDGVFVPDCFKHEQYLIIYENNRKVLISGCSHKGILNIMEWMKPDVLVGGFHYMKQEITDSGNKILDKASQELMQYDTQYYTCHCTGMVQYEYMKKCMGEKLHYLASGQTILI